MQQILTLVAKIDPTPEQYKLLNNTAVVDALGVPPKASRLTAKHKNRLVKKFKPTSFDCDARTFRFISDGYLVSISTTGKRVKIANQVSPYHMAKLKNQNQPLLHADKHR